MRGVYAIAASSLPTASRHSDCDEPLIRDRPLVNVVLKSRESRGSTHGPRPARTIISVLLFGSIHCLFHRRIYALLLIALGAGASACGDKSPTTPTPPSTNLTLSSIAPSQGSTTGGNNLTINGANFTSDATVIIGGVVATNVAVQSSTMLTAVLGTR